MVPATFHTNGRRWPEHNLSDPAENKEHSGATFSWDWVEKCPSCFDQRGRGVESRYKALKCADRQGIILKARQRSHVSRKGAKSLTLTLIPSSQPQPSLTPGQLPYHPSAEFLVNLFLCLNLMDTLDFLPSRG